MHLEFTGTKTEFDTFRADLARTGYLIGESATRDGCDCMPFTRHGLHFHAQLAVLAPDRPAGTWSIDGLRDRVAAALAGEFDRQWPNHDLRGIEWRSIAAAGLSEVTGWGPTPPDAGHVRVPLTGAELVEDIADRMAQATGVRVEVVHAGQHAVGEPPLACPSTWRDGTAVCAVTGAHTIHHTDPDHTGYRWVWSDDVSDQAVATMPLREQALSRVVDMIAGGAPGLAHRVHETVDAAEVHAGLVAGSADITHAELDGSALRRELGLKALAHGPGGQYVVFETSDQRRLTLTQAEFDALQTAGIDPATLTRHEVLVALEQTGS